MSLRAKRAAPAPGRAREPAARGASLRRVPTQARSRERLARILDAAGRAFDEAGVEAATMEAIADRAGTSVGSLYQFFPNKEAIFDALREQYIEGGNVVFEEIVAAAGPAAPWRDLLDRVVDAFWTLHASSPGFRAVWMRAPLSPELLARSDASQRALAARAEQVLARFAAGVPRRRRVLAATMLVETISMMLWTAARREEPDASAIVDETKRMLKAYLAELFAGR
jgi:AcrR family transcriptional regulator